MTGQVTRRDLVDAVNKQIVANNARRFPHPAPLLRYRAWQRAVCIARHHRLFSTDVITAVAKHGVYLPADQQKAAA